jgi:hypothetical protein
VIGVTPRCRYSYLLPGRDGHPTSRPVVGFRSNRCCKAASTGQPADRRRARGVLQPAETQPYQLRQICDAVTFGFPRAPRLAPALGRVTIRGESSNPNAQQRHYPHGAGAAARAEGDSPCLPGGWDFEPASRPQEPRLFSIDGRGRPDRKTRGEARQNPDLRTADRPLRPSGRAAGYCLEGPSRPIS